MADQGTEIVTATPVETPALVTTPMELLSRALERGADLAMVEKLMDLAERHEHNEARRAFNVAMADAKAKIPVIKKNRQVGYTSKRTNEDTSYSYEDLAAIAEVVTPILADYGLSYRFRTSSVPGEPIMVTCIITHRLGHSEENTLQGPRDDSGKKNGIQAIGSTCTYLQRMTLKAALGLAAAADDDGRASADGDEPISAEQLEEIRAKIETSGADIERFCRYLAVDALPDIRKRDYPKALAAIAQKIKAKKQAGGAQ